MSAARDAKQRQMRDLEDRLQRLQQNNKDELRFAAVADWETRTTDRIKASAVQARFAALQARREGDLEVRRQRLADRLAYEDAALKDELLSQQATPEQRRSALAARARALAERREAERAALAASLLDRAFQEKCDVLRDTNSKRILYRTLDERNAQIEQKMAAKIVEAEEKRLYAEMNEQERLNKEQRHADDVRKDKEAKADTLKVLDAQVRAVTLRRADEAQAKAAETAELTALWAKIAQEQEDAEAADRQRMQQLAAELQEFNRMKRTEMSDAERAERESDLAILQDALAKEADDEARETAAREGRREDARRYRAQLALMMQRDAEDQAERDGMIMQAFLEQQAKRDAEFAAREEARRRLMAEVDAIRQEQIRYKQQQRVLEMEAVGAEREELLLDQASAAADADAKRIAARKKALTGRLEVQAQMVSKAHMRAAEEDEKLRALEMAAAAEQAYMGKVKAALVATDPPMWHGRRKFDFYS